MSRFIDRRTQGRNKSAVNRQRFLKRFKTQIRKSVTDAISKRKISNIEQGENITIPTKDLREPFFQHGATGKKEIVFPGNQHFLPGDKIKRESANTKNNQSNASNSGSGQDEFEFKISGEEFLDIFFDDLALPNLIKAQIAKSSVAKLVRSGITTQGSPSNINIIRSFRSAIGRRIAISGSIKSRIDVAKKKLGSLVTQNPPANRTDLTTTQDEIDRLNKRLKNIPFIDPFDLRYNNRTIKQQPTTQAVMFCIMDVSGSMDEAKKDLAKRFFILLFLFLKRNYETIDIVFIRHHTSAKEVNEQEFFYSRETGGTVVSSSLELMRDIMTHRYPNSEWNIYGAQASDGDNWNNDSPRCRDILIHDIMPHVQYFSYVEIMPRHHQSLWEVYKTVKETNRNFAMQHISQSKEIYPVFREFFRRQHPAIPNRSGFAR
jgi:uncharacterized protein